MVAVTEKKMDRDLVPGMGKMMACYLVAATGKKMACGLVPERD